MALTQSTPEQVLRDRVGAVRTRIRLLLAQQALCVGLTVAAGAGLLFVAATRLRWWTDAVDYLWALFLVGGGAGLIWGWSRRISPMVAAQIADERGGLKERLSTAVELSGSEARGELADAQIADAAVHARNMQPSQVLPWRMPPQGRWLAAACAVLAGAIFLPDLPLFHSTQDRLDRAAMQVQGEQLQRVAKELEKQAKKTTKEDENGEILKRIAREMKQLGKEQEKGRISKKQAMLKLNDLQKQVKEAQNDQSGGKSQKPMDQVASQLQQAAQKHERAGNQEGARQLQQMAQNMGKKDFDAAKRQLEDLAKKMQSGKMSADDAQKAADTLEQMAKAMEGSSMDKASKEMKEAAKQLSQAAAAAKQLQQQMASSKSDAERQKLQQEASQKLSEGMQQAAQNAQKSGGTCKACAGGQQSSEAMKQMAQSLQSAQQSLQQAGQQSADGKQGEGQEATEAEMGKEFQPGQGQGQGQQGQGKGQGKGQQGQGQGQGQGQQGGQSGQGGSQPGSGSGQGMGGPGRGRGGTAGPQQPLPGPKKDMLVQGMDDPNGKRISRSYMGTPDPKEDKAAYYQVVPERVRAVEASLNREEIPKASATQVRKYFDAIQPR